MTPLVEKALQTLTDRVNLKTGLTHPSDDNAAREMFERLHAENEILTASEIQDWAKAHGWNAKDAEHLGSLGQQIGMGKPACVTNGPWWSDNIIEQMKSSDTETDADNSPDIGVSPSA